MEGDEGADCGGGEVVGFDVHFCPVVRFRLGVAEVCVFFFFLFAEMKCSLIGVMRCGLDILG